MKRKGGGGEMAAVASKDPAIKLFGRTISLPDSHFSDDSESLDNGSSLLAKPETEQNTKSSSTQDEVISFEHSNGEHPQNPIKQPILSQSTINPKPQQEESDGSEETKQLKRPDKILPCPRCNSSETKFCYFNNYNVNQPRHFCKSCQRYWTAGGTVRNVPVGAGRRRNKQLASQYRQVLVTSDAGPTMVPEGGESANQIISCEESSSSCTSPNEMVLKFGPGSPHFDNSRANLSIREGNNRCSEMDPCNSSSSSAHHLYHYVVPPHISPSRTHLNGSVPLGMPGFPMPNGSYQMFPGAYMNCIPVWVDGSGSVSLAVPNGCVSSSLISSGNRLQVLGKHSRDLNLANDGRTQGDLSAHKTVRIHELDQA